MTDRAGGGSAQRLWIERSETRLVLGGSLTADEAASWRAAVMAQAEGPVCRLDLGDLDLITALRDRHGPLLLSEAPQMLAHTLYKVGALGNGISLEAPRTDVGTTAN